MWVSVSRIFPECRNGSPATVALAEFCCCYAWPLVLLTIARARRGKRATLATGLACCPPCWPQSWLGGSGRSSYRQCSLASAISLSFYFGFFLSYSQQETALVARLGMFGHAVFSPPLRCWAKGPVGLVLQSGDCGVFCAAGASYGRARQNADAGEALLFFAVATLVDALAAQAWQIGPFFFFFFFRWFRFQHLERFTPPSVRHAGPLVFYLALVPAALLPLVVLLAPGRRPGFGYWRLGLVAASSPELPSCGPRSAGLVPWCVVVLLRRRHKLLGYICRGAMRSAAVACIGIPCAGQRNGIWP